VDRAAVQVDQAAEALVDQVVTVQVAQVDRAAVQVDQAAVQVDQAAVQVDQAAALVDQAAEATVTNGY
jgi:hypothetical protein